MTARILSALIYGTAVLTFCLVIAGLTTIATITVAVMFALALVRAARRY